MSNFIIKFSKVKMLSHFKGITKQLLLLIKELANLSFAMRREDVLNTLSQGFLQQEDEVHHIF